MSLWQHIKQTVTRMTAGCQAPELLALVREAYSAAANAPGGCHTFPVGRAFAEEVGYPQSLLDTLPAQAADICATR